jgi:UDP-N-acetylglucosamine--N-acetylmuramyl-(pentapeptide) pyrophosphoryl-undecaprenol N-acetylglucosamine transferase
VGEADLVLSRSGATTCAELTVAGRAALLVPFAGAADDHQTTNARALAAAGAARVIEERELTGESLARAIEALVDAPETLAAMDRAARQLGRKDAAVRVADLLSAPGEARA